MSRKIHPILQMRNVHHLDSQIKFYVKGHKINNWNKFALNPIISHMPDTNFWHIRRF